MGLAVCGCHQADGRECMRAMACGADPLRQPGRPGRAPLWPPSTRPGSKQAEGRRDAGVWMLAHAYGMCVGGWRAVQVVPVARCGAACGAHRWSQQASLVVDATG